MATSLLDVLHGAARGRPPAPDGAVDVVGPPPGRAQAVVAFTAHHVVAAAVEPDAVLARLPADDLSAPMSPPFLRWLGQRLGARQGILDMVFVALSGDTASSAVDLDRRDGLESHQRVERAMRYRDDTEAYEERGGRGVVVLGRGLAGRLEMAFEVGPRWRGEGWGRRLAAAARDLAPPDEPLYAQVSPGNVASVRAMLAAGYRPIGSEVLFIAEGAGQSRP
jgi:GNAT superfamily N-acetyltransferase